MEEKIKNELLNKIETLTDSYAFNEIINNNYSNRELFQILEELEYDEYMQRRAINMNLKEKMIEEINSYIRRTRDYDLVDFISEEMVSYMDRTNKELIWYPTKKDENNYIIDISIENA